MSARPSPSPSPWPAALTSAGLGVVIAVVLSLGLGSATSPADAGSNPAPGVAGAEGRAGIDGRDGADGLDGADGAPGAPGPRGASGPAGRDGADGHDGIDGADGVDGSDGAPGATGATGPAGSTGATGATGPAGPAGDDALVTAANHSLVSVGGGAAPTPLHGRLAPGTYLVAVSWTSIQAEYPAGPSSDVIQCHVGTIAGGGFTPSRRIHSLPVVEFELIQSGPSFSVFRKSGESGFGVIELAAEAQLGFACDGSSGTFRGAGFWDFSSAVWQVS
jgi:hypothetical protein